MSPTEPHPRPAPPQRGGLDFQALRQEAARGLYRRLYVGYGDEQRDAKGRPRRVQIPPLIDGGRGPETLREIALRWTERPFPTERFQALKEQGRDLDLSPDDRLVIFHRAAMREGVAARLGGRQSVAPLRNAVTEEATQLITGRPWNVKAAEAEPLDAVEQPRPCSCPEHARREAALHVAETWRRARLADADLQAEAVRLRYVEDLSREEIAAKLYDDYDPDDPEAVRRCLDRVDNLLGVALKKLREAAGV